MTSPATPADSAAATSPAGPIGSAGRRARLRRPPRSPARPRRDIRPGEAEETLSVASSALGVVALVCAWMLLQLLVLGGISEARSQTLLYTEYRTELAQATAPTGALDFEGTPVAAGSPVAILKIPVLGLEQVVVSGTASGDLVNGPGHLRSTPLPGQAGISVVMGRASTYGAPFGDLAKLPIGAPIQVQNAEGQVTYKVIDIRRAGDPFPPAPTGKEGRLTLVSAEHGDGFLGALQPQDAIYVDAVTKKATPAGVVASAVPASEQVMARDISALPTLVLLLAGLVALVLAVSVARRSFQGTLVWMFAAPTAIALAWATTDQVVRLLPNLM